MASFASCVAKQKFIIEIAVRKRLVINVIPITNYRTIDVHVAKSETAKFLNNHRLRYNFALHLHRNRFISSTCNCMRSYVG